MVYEKKIIKCDSIEEYADILRSFIGKYYVNEWGGYFGGPNYPQPCVCMNTRITRDTIKRLADGMGDTNPLFRDPEYAKKTKYGGIIAPPYWTFSITYGVYPEFATPDYSSLYVGDRLTWYQPAAPGDKIDYKSAWPTSVEIKQTRTGGQTVFCDGVHLFQRHQGGIPLVRHEYTTCYIPIKTANYSKMESGREKKEYTQEYIDSIIAAQDSEKPWGSTPHWFEDVSVGETLDPIVRGPFSLSENNIWIYAAGQYFFSSDRLHRMVHEQSGWGFYQPEMNIWFNLHENSFDDWGGVREHSGSYVPGGFGSQRASWVMLMLNNFASDEGFLWKLNLQHRRKGGFHNVFWTTGVITDKHVENGRCWVDIDVKIEDQTGALLLKGDAKVILPSREFGPITYPSPERAFDKFFTK